MDKMTIENDFLYRGNFKSVTTEITVLKSRHPDTENGVNITITAGENSFVLMVRPLGDGKVFFTEEKTRVRDK